MSIKYVNRVLDLQLPPVPKLVMVVIADNADDQGTCWPRLSRIAARASVSERTAQRTKVELVRQDLLEVTARHRSDGSRMSDKYQLFPQDSRGGVILTPPPRPSTVLPGPHVDLGGDSPVTSITTTETSIELPTLHTALGGGGASVEVPNCFEGPAQEIASRLISDLKPELQQQLLDEVDENYRQRPEKTVPLRLLRHLSGLARRGQFRPELCFMTAERRSARRRFDKAAESPAPEASPEVVAAAKKRLALIRDEIAGKTHIGKAIGDVLATCLPGHDAIADAEKK